MSEKEHLVRINLKDGGAIDMHKQDGDVTLSSDGHEVTIPHATGQQALDLYALLEPLGESVEFPEEDET